MRAGSTAQRIRAAEREGHRPVLRLRRRAFERQAPIDKALRIAELAMRFGEVCRSTRHPDGRPETDTTHTVMLALLALELAPQGLNPLVAAAFAVVHDLVETWAGDTCTAWGLSPTEQADKDAREDAARGKLAELGLVRVLQLVREYDQQTSAEARFIRFLDKITPQLTHLLNSGAALRAIGMSSGQMRVKHSEQEQRLAGEYPEQIEMQELFRAASQRCALEIVDP